jgi:TatD DNase family protein
MRLIDIGVNLMSGAFDKDRDAVAAEAEAAGVSPFIITGSSVESSKAAALYAASRRVYATAGVHPHNARFWDEEAAASIRRLAAPGESPSAVRAVGECGLDYNRNFSPRDKQLACFEDQIRLAIELGLPLFLHVRDAFEDFSALLGKYRRDLGRFVVHCFTGAGRELDMYLEAGAFIGITGWVCDERRGKHLIPLLKNIPPDRLLLETDAPYLLPRGLGKGRNEPKYLTHIAAFIAGHLGKPPDTLAAETYEAAGRFFAR